MEFSSPKFKSNSLLQIQIDFSSPNTNRVFFSKYKSNSLLQNTNRFLFSKNTNRFLFSKYKSISLLQILIDFSSPKTIRILFSKYESISLLQLQIEFSPPKYKSTSLLQKYKSNFLL